VVERGGLENRCAASPYRGFESLPLRCVTRGPRRLDLVRGRRYGDGVIDDAVIDEAGRTLAANASSPARVVLFGSRARGEGRPDSDLDFLVIEERVDGKASEMVKLRAALPALGVPVDVLVVSEAEASKRGAVKGTLIHRALTEGRVLVEP
jgi:uncharacterized protein